MTKINNYIRGDTRVIILTCYQPDGTTPLDLTGATVKFTLSLSDDPGLSDTPALQKTITSHTSPTLGITTITIDPADTESLAAGTYNYDAEVTDASGHRSSIKKDKFIINADITRS